MSKLKNEQTSNNKNISKLVTKGQACVTVDKEILKIGKNLAKLDRRSFSSYVENLIAKDSEQHNMKTLNEQTFKV